MDKENFSNRIQIVIGETMHPSSANPAGSETAGQLDKKYREPVRWSNCDYVDDAPSELDVTINDLTGEEQDRLFAIQQQIIDARFAAAALDHRTTEDR